MKAKGSRLINFRIIFRVLKTNLLIIGIALLLTSLISFIYNEDPYPFLEPGILSLIIGVIIYFLTREKNPLNPDTLEQKEALLTVSSSWLIIGLVGAIPFITSGAIPHIPDAIFESVSGFTTTGSSILTDIESLPKSILFWRSFTHWLGGIGIIVLVIVVMPSLHIGSYHLFSSESSLQDKILPRIKAVGNRLLFIYTGLTLLEIGLLLLGKMNLFESVCHAFGTIATGGFSPRNTSIAEYSPYIQYVIMIFMFLAGINFVIHYYALKFDISKIKQNEEFKYYVLAVFAVSSAVSITIFRNMNVSFEEAFRHGFFQTISIITCTGFATADYLQWPSFAWILLFFAMFLGGSTGSTAGGIKIARHVILFKNFKRSFKRTLSPNAIIPIRLNNNVIDEDSNRSILAFISLYLIVFIIGTVIIAFLGNDIKTSSSAVATCMAGIGPGIGKVGPASNFAHFSDFGKITLSILMLIGRLEIYTLLMFLNRDFWRT